MKTFKKTLGLILATLPISLFGLVMCLNGYFDVFAFALFIGIAMPLLGILGMKMLLED